VQWLGKTFYIAESGSLPKAEVYNAYCQMCSEEGVQPVSNAVFGRLMVGKAFPSLVTRRQGRRGMVKYHYMNLQYQRLDERPRERRDNGRRKRKRADTPKRRTNGACSFSEERPMKKYISEDVRTELQVHLRDADLFLRPDMSLLYSCKLPSTSSCFFPSLLRASASDINLVLPSHDDLTICDPTAFYNYGMIEAPSDEVFAGDLSLEMSLQEIERERPEEDEIQLDMRKTWERFDFQPVLNFLDSRGEEEPHTYQECRG